jgi:Ran GTPase-activating protein (RanGAP) involved in mRNA processing and transport
VAQSRCLTDVQLRSCAVRNAVAEALAAALERGGCIRTLDLSHNDFGSAGVAALARLLASGRCALTALDVTGNWIGCDDALALAGSLQANRSLTELRLGHSEMEGEATTAVIAALQNNPHVRLRVLILDGESISQPDATSLAEVVQRSRTLERLKLCGCYMGDEGVTALAAGIGRSRTLQRLDLSATSFGAAGATALAAAVATCPAFTALTSAATISATRAWPHSRRRCSWCACAASISAAAA